ncbi:MAG: hypothetical protein NTY65_03640 [Planctomycetota bacterium]|nr:hypothetical protein [Planctomycetota bacterium]
MLRSLVIAGLMLLCGCGTPAATGARYDELAGLLNEWKSTDAQKSRLKSLLSQAVAAEDGGVAVMQRVLGNPRQENSAAVFDALREVAAPQREKLLVGLLTCVPELSQDIRSSCAIHLAATTRRCGSENLFKRVKGVGRPDDTTIWIVQAFVESRKAEVQSLAIMWADTLIKPNEGEEGEGLHDSLVELLGLVKTDACNAALLRYLDRCWEDDLACIVLKAVESLAAAKYSPSFNRLKVVARERDGIDEHVRVAALRGVAEMARPEQADELIAIALSISNSLDPMPEESQHAVDEILARLRNLKKAGK